MPKDRKRPKISDRHPLRVLIAPDKFKGTLTSEEAAKAIEKGLRRAWPKVRTTCFTLTDGGEGFMELMVRQTRGRLRAARTVGACSGMAVRR
jgi:glycerate kinase